jgi:TFIIE alpha subunit
MDTTHQKQTPWFDLLELVRLCPGQVPADNEAGMVAITGNTRLLLFAFAQHANVTDETWVSRRTLHHETQMSINTLDTAISNLKRAGLLRVRKEFDDSRLTWRHYWIIQRERLKALVGDEISEELVANVVKAAIEDGQSRLRCSPARVEQAKTAIWKAAESTFMKIDELPIIGDKADKVLLYLSVGTKSEVDVPDGEVRQQPKSGASLREENRKMALNHINDLKDPSSLDYGGSSTFYAPESQALPIKEFVEMELPGALVELHESANNQVMVRISWRPKKQAA